MTISWTIEVDTHAPEEISFDEIEEIALALEAPVTRDTATGRIAVTFEVVAPTLRQASDAGLKAANAALPARVESLRVVTTERWIDEIRHPRSVALVGVGEAAVMLGVSKQRVAQLAADHQDFPEPIARLASGPVFTRDSVTSFSERWERRITGRPKKIRD